jgi:Uma2 family endonuclease
MTLYEPQTHRWTRDQYYRLGDAGLFAERRVELIDGEIIDVPPQRSSRFTAVMLTQKVLDRCFGVGFVIRAQGPLDLGPDSQPEPDVAVVTGGARDYDARHPTSAVLVVAVSETSLRFDRGRKKLLYAEAGIGEYWILNLVDRVLEVHRAPKSGRYQEDFIVDAAGTIAPLAMADVAVAVAGMLP